MKQKLILIVLIFLLKANLCYGIEEITNIESIAAPIYINGKKSGEMQIPPGKIFKIESVKGDEIEVFYNGLSIKINKSKTNYESILNQERLNAEQYEKKRKEEEDFKNNLIAKQKEEELNAVGFKGLNLGMPIERFQNLIYSTRWSVVYSELATKKFITGGSYKDRSIDFSIPKQSFKLDTDGSPYNEYGKYDNPNLELSDDEKNNFRSIGKEGDFWYNWWSVFVRFYEGKLSTIIVEGSSYSADKLQTSIKSWLHMAKMGLANKYGNPTKQIKSLDSFNIFDCKSDQFSSFLVWNVRNKTILLGVNEHENKYSPQIMYIDDELANKRHKEEQPTSNL
jgi:hypothetical protein